MSAERRTEILRRRIELYLHCLGEGISTAERPDFVRQLAEAEDELLILTVETARYGDTAHANR